MKAFRRSVLIFLALILLLSLPLALRLRRRIRSAAEDHARVLTESILTEAAGLCAREGLFSYDALMHRSLSPSGELLALSPDAAMLQLLCQRMMEQVNALLADESRHRTQFPLGSVLGSDLLSAWGPPVSLRLSRRHTLRAEIRHSLEEAGINQSLHTVTLRISGSVRILLAADEPELSVCRDLPVCQTLLLGKVPSYLGKVL